MNWLKSWLLVAFTCWTTAQAGAVNDCGNSPRMDVAQVKRQVMAAEALWRQRGPKHYSLNVTSERGLGHFSLRISVEQGVFAKPIEFRVLSNFPPEYKRQLEQQLDQRGDMLARRYTVNALFEQIHNITALHSTRGMVNACGVFKAKFDATDGHPRSLTYDFAFSIDEEFSYTTSPLIY